MDKIVERLREISEENVKQVLFLDMNSPLYPPLKNDYDIHKKHLKSQIEKMIRDQISSSYTDIL